MTHARIFNTRSVSSRGASTARRLLALVVVAGVAITDGACGQAHAATDALQVQEARQALLAYFDAYVAQDRDALRRLTTDDFELIENGYPMDLARFQDTWLPLRASIEPDLLTDYTGTYGDTPNGYHVVRERAALYAERIDRKAWSADVRRVELIPTGRDEFVLEFDETPVKFDRDASGRVVAVGLPALAGSGTTRFAKASK